MMSVSQTGTSKERLRGTVLQWSRKTKKDVVKRLSIPLILDIPLCKDITEVLEVMKQVKSDLIIELAFIERVKQIGYDSIERGDGLPHLNQLLETEREVQRGKEESEEKGEGKEGSQ